MVRNVFNNAVPWRVVHDPKTTSFCLARVIATLTRRQSFSSEPTCIINCLETNQRFVTKSTQLRTSFWGLERTKEIIIHSLSLP